MKEHEILSEVINADGSMPQMIVIDKADFDRVQSWSLNSQFSHSDRPERKCLDERATVLNEIFGSKRHHLEDSDLQRDFEKASAKQFLGLTESKPVPELVQLLLD